MQLYHYGIKRLREDILGVPVIDRINVLQKIEPNNSSSLERFMNTQSQQQILQTNMDHLTFTMYGF